MPQAEVIELIDYRPVWDVAVCKCRSCGHGGVGAKCDCGCGKFVAHTVCVESDLDHLECDRCGAMEMAVTHWLPPHGAPVPRFELVK